MIYFGTVENIDDPLDSGRVQVRVFPFYRDFNTKDLPWAFVERSTDFGPTNGRGINQHNLIEGTQVTVEFLDDQLQQPLVRGILPRSDDFGDNPSVLTHELKFLNGAKITVNETPDDPYIEVLDTQKNVIRMDNTGITIHVGDSTHKVNVESSGDIKLEATGSIYTKSGQNTSITATGETSIDSTGNLSIKSSGETSIESSGNTNIKSSGETTIEGSKLNLKNILGKNQLCALPACLFTGTPHIQPNSD